jgi:hypothetical protein
MARKKLADWMMDYAEERKQRMRAEQRLLAMLFFLVPYVSAVQKLGDAVLDKDKMKASKYYIESIKLGIDLEVLINLELVKPTVEGAGLDIEELRGLMHGTRLEIPKKLLDQLEVSAKATIEEWDTFAKNNDFNTVEEAKDCAKGFLIERVIKARK